MADHPTPSARARELVAGAYDIHIHVAPDVMRRRIDDLALAPQFAAVGLAGFVLKSHYAPTAERAAVVRAAVPGFGAVGAITLNGSVGGMNPIAVEVAGRGGAQVVWLPTVDSANQRACTAGDPGAPSRPCGPSSRRSCAPGHGGRPGRRRRRGRHGPRASPARSCA